MPPCLGPVRIYCARQKKWIAFSAAPNIFCGGSKTEFTKCKSSFNPAQKQYVNHFGLTKLGPAQTILGPVEGQVKSQCKCNWRILSKYNFALKASNNLE